VRCMKEEELEIVFRAIEKHADGFWNEEPREGNEAWNGYLFLDILDAVQKEGYDLRVVRR